MKPHTNCRRRGGSVLAALRFLPLITWFAHEPRFDSPSGAHSPAPDNKQFCIASVLHDRFHNGTHVDWMSDDMLSHNKAVGSEICHMTTNRSWEIVLDDRSVFVGVETAKTACNGPKASDVARLHVPRPNPPEHNTAQVKIWYIKFISSNWRNSFADTYIRAKFISSFLQA